MAGKKKQAPAKFEEPEEDEGWEEAVAETEEKEPAADVRLRDWRDVERYREMKELRRLVDEDDGFEDIFQAPVRPRSETTVARPAARPQKPAPEKPAAKAAEKPAAAKAKPAAKKNETKAKAKSKHR